MHLRTLAAPGFASPTAATARPGGLDTLTLAYLAAPMLLFSVGWLRPVWGLPLAALVALALALVLRTRADDTEPSQCRSSRWTPWIFAVAVLFIMGFPAGPYAWDWIKHWALVNLLSETTWPALWDGGSGGGGPLVLRFYTGAYLVPAGLHRLLPVGSPALWLGLWFGLGLVLVGHQVARQAQRQGGAPAVALLAFVLCGAGADAWADWAARGAQPSLDQLITGLHVDPWAQWLWGQRLQYTSNLGLLAWVPHQALATMLTAALLLGPPSAARWRRAVLAYGLLPLWSPLGAIGLLPLLVVRSLPLLGPTRRAALREWASWAALAAAMAAAVAVAAYLSTDVPTGTLCVSCAPLRLLLAADFLPFLAVELGAMLLLLSRRDINPLNACSLAVLLVLPLFYGETADFVMRASIGPLFLLTTAGAARLSAWPSLPQARRLLVLVAALLTAPTVVNEVVYHRSAGAAHRERPIDDPRHASWAGQFVARTDVTVQQFLDTCGWIYRRQYFTPQWPAVLAKPNAGAHAEPADPAASSAPQGSAATR